MHKRSYHCCSRTQQCIEINLTATGENVNAAASGHENRIQSHSGLDSGTCSDNHFPPVQLRSLASAHFNHLLTISYYRLFLYLVWFIAKRLGPSFIYQRINERCKYYG